MSFINHIENNFIEIIKLLIFTMIIIFINFAIIMLQSKKDIQDNWNTYRCNPLVMPLASFFGHDTFSNFGQCLFTQTAGFTGTFLQPIHYMMQIITRKDEVIVEALVHLVFINKLGRPTKIPDLIYENFKPYFCDSIKN